jgi:Arc/MetJ family transcription regulator
LAEKAPAKRGLQELSYCVSVRNMATNLSIDPKLIESVLKVSGERTKKAVVTKALQEFIARRSQRRLLDLVGKLEWEDSYDYKKERTRD